jgi:hypothetical protein
MEESMKSNRVGIVVLFAAIMVIAVPAWSQDETPSMQQPAEAQGKEVSMEKPSGDLHKASPAQQSSDAASVVQIEDAFVCQDVVDRSPVGAGDKFAKETAKVYCFCRVVGAPAGAQITHNWYYNGALKASVKLNVGSTNYRTWSSKTLQPGWVGEWMVEILGDDGSPLESIVFIIE